MSAAYPASVLNWTNRINSQTVFAADPNALAAEIEAIETIVGVNPQIESSALVGSSKVFSSLSARVSDAMLQRGHPFIQLQRTTPWAVTHSNSTTHVTQNPYGTAPYVQNGYGTQSLQSGVVIIQDAGLWMIDAEQRWDYAASGWVMQELYSGGTVLRRNVFSYSQFPSSGSNTYGERFLGLNGHTQTTFLGRLSAGTRISVASGNYTSSNPLNVNSMTLALYFIRP